MDPTQDTNDINDAYYDTFDNDTTKKKEFSGCLVVPVNLLLLLVLFMVLNHVVSCSYVTIRNDIRAVTEQGAKR